MILEFLGQRPAPWRNRKTGEVGTSYFVDFMDHNGVKPVKVTEDFYKQLQAKAIAPRTRVELVPGLIKGNSEGYYLGLVDLEPVASGSSSPSSTPVGRQ